MVEAEHELEVVEREESTAIAAAQERVSRARKKARDLRERLWHSEEQEDAAYQRELASAEVVEQIERALAEMPATANGTSPMENHSLMPDILEAGDSNPWQLGQDRLPDSLSAYASFSGDFYTSSWMAGNQNNLH
jgi:hypothetical protein